MRLFVAILSLAAALPLAAAGAGSGVTERLWKRYCLDCHDAVSRKAEVDLSRFDQTASFLKERRLWLRVLEVLESGEMPPSKRRKPRKDELGAMIAAVRAALENVDWKAVRAPGPAAAVRLTRSEYEYAARDLFGVSVNLEGVVPVDADGPSGFVNDRSVLMMTARQLDGFMKAAEMIAAAVVDNAFVVPARIRYEVEDGENANWKKRPTRREDGAVGWSLTAALGQKHQSVTTALDVPRTGEWRVRVRAASTGPGLNAGMWIAVDSVNDASREAGVLVTNESLSVYETSLFIPAGRRELIFGYDFYRPLWLPEVPDRPQMKLGQSTYHPPPYDRAALLPAGIDRDQLAARGLVTPAEESAHVERLLGFVNDGYYRAVLDRLMLNRFHYERGYLPVFIGGFDYDYTEKVLPAFDTLAGILGTNRAELLKIWKESEPPSFGELEKFLSLQREAWTRQDRERKGQVGGLFVDWIELEPVTNAVRALPEDGADVGRYLEELLPKALRRPVPKAKRAEFESIYRDERGHGASHRDALARTLTGLLLSPDSLYRYDGETGNAGVWPLDRFALASRLAAFLWSSVPDAPFKETERPSLLVDAMLDDPRGRRFARMFTEQWLDLSGIGRSREPDKEMFRYFSWHLAEDMRAEVAEMFYRLLRENRSVIELLDAKDALLNERMARLYGIDGVTGAELRPVLLVDSRRGGLLGTAAVLTATSLATRTSPVRRGQFVLETLLGVDLHLTSLGWFGIEATDFNGTGARRLPGLG